MTLLNSPEFMWRDLPKCETEKGYDHIFSSLGRDVLLGGLLENLIKEGKACKHPILGVEVAKPYSTSTITCTRNYRNIVI